MLDGVGIDTVQKSRISPFTSSALLRGSDVMHSSGGRRFVGGEFRHSNSRRLKGGRPALEAKQERMETAGYVPMISLGMQSRLLLLLPWGRCGNSRG